MLSFQLLGALSSAALLVSGFPLFPRTCPTTGATMDLPADQTKLVNPNAAPKFILLGAGVQNYSCSAATSTYASIGAVASLFDISCQQKSPAFANIQNAAFDILEAAPADASVDAIGRAVGAPELMGYHYFVSFGTGISPKWDFTSTGSHKGDASAYVIGAKDGNISPPNDPKTDVDWLVLHGVEGSLAAQMFRVDTVGGQPPSSCTPGSDPISVKYTAKYYLY
ncbi:hypothetical protein R3P38DRAFT_3576721 [Favolaschia claudopus]|uniref:Malate dehydrogenase n=1 Tax=Favolaschia claudopus TaxID=2862362 RepID=A0AAW0DP40_9AGAR